MRKRPFLLVLHNSLRAEREREREKLRMIRMRKKPQKCRLQKTILAPLIIQVAQRCRAVENFKGEVHARICFHINITTEPSTLPFWFFSPRRNKEGR